MNSIDGSGMNGLRLPLPTAFMYSILLDSLINEHLNKAITLKKTLTVGQ